MIKNGLLGAREVQALDQISFSTMSSDDNGKKTSHTRNVFLLVLEK